MDTPMTIVIPGGSGQVGTVLARAFHAGGHDVVVLSRRPEIRPWRTARLIESGFTFAYPDWRGAAPDLCQPWKGAALDHTAA